MIFWDWFQWKEHHRERCTLRFAMYKLRNAIKQKRQGMLSRGVHMLQSTQQLLPRLQWRKVAGFQEIKYTLYSQDLAPGCYYLFSKLKKDLQGRKSDDNCS
jgi:hypothetical protein